jgi:hypothetical protein
MIMFKQKEIKLAVMSGLVQYRVTRFASCSDFVHYIFVTADSSLLPATYYINLWIVELRYILIEYPCVVIALFVFSQLVSGTFQQYHIKSYADEFL